MELIRDSISIRLESTFFGGSGRPGDLRGHARRPRPRWAAGAGQSPGAAPDSRVGPRGGSGPRSAGHAALFGPLQPVQQHARCGGRLPGPHARHHVPDHSRSGAKRAGGQAAGSEGSAHSAVFRHPRRPKGGRTGVRERGGWSGSGGGRGGPGRPGASAAFPRRGHGGGARQRDVRQLQVLPSLPPVSTAGRGDPVSVRCDGRAARARRDPTSLPAPRGPSGGGPRAERSSAWRSRTVSLTGEAFQHLDACAPGSYVDGAWMGGMR